MHTGVAIPRRANDAIPVGNRLGSTLRARLCLLVAESRRLAIAGIACIRAGEHHPPGGHVRSFLTRTAIAMLCIVAITTAAAAQAPMLSNSLDTLDTQAAAPRSAPTMMAVSVDSTAIFRPAQQEVAPVLKRRRAFSQPAVLMIVGGALIVTGLVVGGDAAPVLYISGAGIGGYGLYRYLQTADTRFTR
jgi:hypothetical protein